MNTDRKVYDYDRTKVRDQIVSAFRQRKGEAAPADLVAFTGLPKYQIEKELPAVADEYAGRLKVTASGEIVYSFPGGMVSRYRGFGPGVKRFGKLVAKGLKAALTVLFKVWIMAMLVGYFVLFIALAVLAILASIAGDSAGKGRSRGRSGSMGGMMLGARLIDLFVRIWFYNEVFKTPGQRRHDQDLRSMKRGQRRPLHKAIFSFVFGEPDPNIAHDAVQKRAFIALVRLKKGIILLEDFLGITGLAPAEAEIAINAYLYEFEGSPEVSADGTVYYHFPALLRRVRHDGSGATDAPFARIRPFSANEPKANKLYAAINGVNILFGAYFLYCSLGIGYLPSRAVTATTYFYWFVLNLAAGISANPLLLISVVLGLVPVAFSFLFWLVPAWRAVRLKSENERIKSGNLRRLLWSKAVSYPASLKAPEPTALPEVARPADPRLPTRLVEEIAAWEAGEPLDGAVWRLKELERKLADAETLRAAVRPESYQLGDTVFDTES
jgi:hypothetical protein